MWWLSCNNYGEFNLLFSYLSKRKHSHTTSVLIERLFPFIDFEIGLINNNK